MTITSAELVIPSPDLAATLAFFVDRLGFRIERISPADDPSIVILTGAGVRLRLDRTSTAAPGTLRLACDDPLAVGDGSPTIVAPNGTTIELVPNAEADVDVPPVRQSFVLTSLRDDASWITGRAGMSYRDLVPGRQGGRFIASHIRIDDGGPVPDYVHFHAIRFQMIYCARGWVRVVYEDQGPPFVLEAGDCVLQPPRIRHRVLEASPGLEVIEVGCPARHDTYADHELELPTVSVAPERDFDGQRFVRHIAREATWRPGPLPGFVHRDTGIGAATGGLAGARVVRRDNGAVAAEPARWAHDGELALTVVLGGGASLVRDDAGECPVGAGDAFVIPAGMRHALVEPSDDFEALEVTLPAQLNRHVSIVGGTDPAGARSPLRDGSPPD